ncbi:MAG: hypothetical protein Q8P77_02190 [Candidatus Veblenbacteria bacterium]|nr:hypothetical protein [Candidatus Veblenbacteria bacterium]
MKKISESDLKVLFTIRSNKKIIGELKELLHEGYEIYILSTKKEVKQFTNLSPERKQEAYAALKKYGRAAIVIAPSPPTEFIDALLEIVESRGVDLDRMYYPGH